MCEQLGCAPADVTAWAVGAHGEGMVCWPRFTTVDGTPITELMDEAAVASVVQRCVKGSAEVVAFLKTGSAYAPGVHREDGGGHPHGFAHEVMSVCAHIDGQYGIEDLYMNVPVRLGKNGVEEVVEFDLNDDELAALRAKHDERARGIGEPAGVADLRDGGGSRAELPARAAIAAVRILLYLPVERVVGCDGADRGERRLGGAPVVKEVALPLGRKGSACWSRSTRGTVSGAGAAWTLRWEARTLR